MLAKSSPWGQVASSPLQMPMPASQPTGSDLEAEIWWVQEHHVQNSTRQGMLAVCPTARSLLQVLAAPWMCWWEGTRYIDAPVGYTPARTLNDTGPRWEEPPEDGVSSLQCLSPHQDPLSPGERSTRGQIKGSVDTTLGSPRAP